MLSETNMKKELDWRVWREFALNSTPLVVDFSYLNNIKNFSKTKSLIDREGMFVATEKKILTFVFQLAMLLNRIRKRKLPSRCISQESVQKFRNG